MNRHVVFLMTVLLAHGVAALGHRGVNAGLIPYACTPAGAAYLFAFDPQRGRQAWATFGGGPRGDEMAEQTALREFYEETNCAYAVDALPAITLNGPSITNGFHAFVAQVPYLDAEHIAKPRACVDVERSDWVWVSHRALVGVLGRDAVNPDVQVIFGPVERIRIWDSALASLKNARNEGLLVDDDPCAH